MSFQDKLYPAPTNSFLKQEDLDKRPILDVRNLGIDFGGLTAAFWWTAFPPPAKKPIR